MLDTHALIWAFVAPKSLSKEAARIITDDQSVLLVSAISVCEIATKYGKGKLPEAEPLQRRFIESLDKAGYLLLPIDAETALSAARFTAPHRDPFDRMIAAQGLQLDLPVISLDPSTSSAFAASVADEPPQPFATTARTY